MSTIKVELSGGPLGGTSVDWKTTASGKIVDNDQQTITAEGKRYTYRYAADPDPARTPHAVYCGEVKG